jgi:hypothetical protein
MMQLLMEITWKLSTKLSIPELPIITNLHFLCLETVGIEFTDIEDPP